jgi:hypothetical protein
MKSDAIAAESRHARESNDSQMAQILDQLGSGEDLPVEAIRAANADRAAMVPVFLRAFDEPARPPARPCKMRSSSRSTCSANGAKNQPIDRLPPSCAGRQKKSIR